MAVPYDFALEQEKKHKTPKTKNWKESYKENVLPTTITVLKCSDS